MRLTLSSFVSVVTCFVALSLTGRAAHAQFVFQISPQSYNLGTTDSVNVLGYIINNTNATVFINEPTFTFSGGAGVVVDKASLSTNIPFSLAPGASYGSANAPAQIVTVNSTNAPVQTDSGVIRLLGGANSSASGDLGSAVFEIHVIPEANTLVGYGLGVVTLGLCAVARVRR